MNIKITDRAKKIQHLIANTPNLFIKDLAKKSGCCPGTISRTIRFMREHQKIGIHSLNTGFVISSQATKKEDVNFLRRLHARRTSDYFALKASESDIRHRWHSVEEKNNISLIFNPLNSTSTTALEKSTKILDTFKIK